MEHTRSRASIYIALAFFDFSVIRKVHCMTAIPLIIFIVIIDDGVICAFFLRERERIPLPYGTVIFLSAPAIHHKSVEHDSYYDYKAK